MDERHFHTEPLSGASLARFDQRHAEAIEELRHAKVYIVSTLRADGTYSWRVGGSSTERVRELFYIETALRLSANLDVIMREQEQRLASEEDTALD